MCMIIANFTCIMCKMVCKATNGIYGMQTYKCNKRLLYIFGACVYRRVFCDSIRRAPEFKPRDGASGQNPGHLCKVLLCCG